MGRPAARRRGGGASSRGAVARRRAVRPSGENELPAATRIDQARGRSPARVTATSRRAAAFDCRLLAAARAWRQ